MSDSTLEATSALESQTRNTSDQVASTTCAFVRLMDDWGEPVCGNNLCSSKFDLVSSELKAEDYCSVRVCMCVCVCASDVHFSVRMCLLYTSVLVTFN